MCKYRVVRVDEDVGGQGVGTVLKFNLGDIAVTESIPSARDSFTIYRRTETDALFLGRHVGGVLAA